MYDATSLGPKPVRHIQGSQRFMRKDDPRTYHLYDWETFVAGGCVCIMVHDDCGKKVMMDWNEVVIPLLIL